MELTKRDALRLGLGVVAVAATPATLFAAEDKTAEAIKAFTGGAAVKDGGVEIDAPEIAENGNTVPIGVSAAGAASILVLADGNPNPGVATFNFGKLAGARAASTRVRLSKTQNVVAVAKLEDGSFVKGSRAVKVTIGGCGG